MLRLPPFDFRQPATLADAAAILAGEGAAEGQTVRLVAGGTDLWPNMKRRHQQADTVVGLRRLQELSGIRGGNGAGELRIGAMTTLSQVARDEQVRSRYPALARAVDSISTPVLRNMGTLGGNLCLDTRCTYYNQNEEWRRSIDYCMKEAGSVCWVAPGSPRCWAISASDSAPMLAALGARVRLVSAEAERVIPVADLYRDDGIDYLAKGADEILTEVLLPAEAATGGTAGGAGRAAGANGSGATAGGGTAGGATAGPRTAFWKLRRRGSIDFAVLTAAVALWTDAGGTVERASIYLGAVASYPTPAAAAAEHLLGKPLTEESCAEAAALARKAATPLDNTDFLPQWRATMVERYVEATLREAAGLPTERMAPRHGRP